MTADRLLRLYPRPWRDRYGTEFLETVGPGALQAQQVIDIALGAIDAWLSAEVRRSAVGDSVVPDSGGRAMLATMKATCRDSKVRYTTRDMLISAAVLLAATLVISGAGIMIDRGGHAALGEALKSLSFPVSVTISMPFGVLKGQPWRAQAAVLGATLLILVGAAYLATLI